MICHCGKYAPIVKQVPDEGCVIRLRRCPLDHETVTVEGEIRALFSGKLVGRILSESYSMTAMDVARYFGVSHATVSKWANRGDLVGLKHHKVWRFRPSDVRIYEMLRRSDEWVTKSPKA